MYPSGSMQNMFQKDDDKTKSSVEGIRRNQT